MGEKPMVKLTLTPEQQTQIRDATGKEVATLKLEALEARLAPGMNLTN
jgi:hypothetical protein